MKNKQYRPFKPQTEAHNLFARKGNMPCSEAEALIHQITQELSIGQVDNASEYVAELLGTCFRFSASISPRLKQLSPAGKSKLFRAFKQAVANQV
jgi:hypothetical protein